MLNPIEQSPALSSALGYEQAKHQAPHIAHGDGGAAATAANATVEPAQTVSAAPSTASQQGTSGNGAEDSGDQQQQNAQASQKLSAAWSALAQLKSQAAAAISSGNGALARELASQAAGMAGSIRDIVDSVGGSASAGAQSALQEASSVGAGSVSSGGGGSAPTTPVDLARAGLSAAKDVVDSALQMPQSSQADWTTLSSQQKDVQSAMAGVEAIAAQNSAATSVVSGYSAHSLVDIKA